MRFLPTDQRTDRRTNTPSYRDARTHLKIMRVNVRKGYSSRRGKACKTDEAVNRELNVTRSWNFVQTVDLAWFIAWMSFKLICILDLPEFFLLSLKSLSSGGSPYYWMCWKRLWAWESATDEKSATAPPIYVARHSRFGQTRPNLSILLHIIYMRTLETSLSCKCSIYVLV